jgi:hypothetical protein
MSGESEKESCGGPVRARRMHYNIMSRNRRQS